MQAPKNGFFYVLDAETGAFISAEPFTAISWATHVNKETGRPVETPQARFYRTGQPFTSLQPPNGAHTWHSMSFSPVTGLVYIPIHMQEFIFNDEPAFAPSGLTYNLGIRRGSQAADPAVRASGGAGDHGQLARAVDRVGSRHATRGMGSGARRPGERRRAVDGRRPRVSGHGHGTVHGPRRRQRRNALVGRNTDRRSRSADLLRGRGRQYVAVMVGRGGSWSMAGDEASAKGNDLPNISRLLVFALGGTAELPPAPPPSGPRARTAARDRPGGTVAHGEAVYGAYCSRCHGRAGAANFGILPDLRYSAMLGTSEAWAAVVLDGQLAPNGMASFAR